MRPGPDGGRNDEPANSPDADLVAKVADLECRLEDALRLKREVETQAEIIRVLTRRLDDEQRRAEQAVHPLKAFRYKMIYWTKVFVYRAIHSVAAAFRWRKR
jgi:hypothetical protein